jgi:hypothetical protein
MTRCSKASFASLGIRIPDESLGREGETIPNKPIVTGKTKGPDVTTVQPTTLGELAEDESSRFSSIDDKSPFTLICLP